MILRRRFNSSEDNGGGGDNFVDPYIFNLLFWFDGADTSSEARTLADAYGFGEDRNNIAYSTKVFKNKAKDVGQGSVNINMQDAVGNPLYVNDVIKGVSFKGVVGTQEFNYPIFSEFTRGKNLFLITVLHFSEVPSGYGSEVYFSSYYQSDGNRFTMTLDEFNIELNVRTRSNSSYESFSTNNRGYVVCALGLRQIGEDIASLLKESGGWSRPRKSNMDNGSTSLVEMLGSRYLPSANGNTNENIHICEQRLYVSNNDFELSKIDDIINHLKQKYQ